MTADRALLSRSVQTRACSFQNWRISGVHLDEFESLIIHHAPIHRNLTALKRI